MITVLVTGGFDPIHSGHISYLNEARKLGDRLIVGINSDSWLERKKGRAFMPIAERVSIIENLKAVDGVILFNDDDGTAIEAIKNAQQLYPNDQIIFANGGDRNITNTPEMLMKDVIFKFGIGGGKQNSSSWILDEWKASKTERPWGYYRVLYDMDGTKVKELTVMPNCTLSMQKHQYRNEFWMISEGRCQVDQAMASGYALPTATLSKHDQISIPKGEWHRLYNPFDFPCKIIEIQYGSYCSEDDIVRR